MVIKSINHKPDKQTILNVYVRNLIHSNFDGK